MVAPSKIMIAQVWGTSILTIEHKPLMHMVATLDFAIELSLFFDAHQPIAAFLVATQGEPMHLSTR